MGRVRMYHYVPHRTVGNIFSRAASSISHAVSNAASTVKTAVKADIKVAQSNPLKALELPTLIGVDALKQGVNAGASLYTATTGQKQVLLPYSTNIGGAIAQVSGSDTTSALAAHAAGGIINQVLPVIPLLNKGIFALQNLIDPKSVNLATPATVAPPVTAANSGISAAADAA
ncbi:hypothetical protein, partial [uncultured Mucilaginibacter sp.]|uniref:hypothetical protein n=1 Tax=uncultured Mucilaginibacter sp. TaxID=797541 RepID=UPI0025CD49CE